MTALVPLDSSEWWQRLRDEWTDAESEREEAEQRRARKDRRALRRRLVSLMLLQGVPRRTMAALLGVGVGTIQRDVEWVREEWKARSAEDFDAHVAESMAYMDLARQTAATLMTDTALAAPVRLDALRSLVSTEHRIANLKGLDKPSRTEAKLTVEHTTSLDAEIESLMSELRGAPSVDDADSDAPG